MRPPVVRRKRLYRSSAPPFACVPDRTRQFLRQIGIHPAEDGVHGSGARQLCAHLLPLEDDIGEREQDQHRGDQSGDLGPNDQQAL